MSIEPTSRPKRPRDPGSSPLVTTRWQDMTLDAKLFYYVLATDRNSTAKVFTVDFTRPTLLRRGASTLEPAQYVNQRFRLFLPKIPRFFILEVSPAGLLHLHGLLDPLDHDDSDIKVGLEKVAGDRRKLASKKGTSFLKKYAVDLKPADWGRRFAGRQGPYGWANYMAKSLKTTRKHLGAESDLVCVSHDVTRLAKQMHREDVEASRP